MRNSELIEAKNEVITGSLIRSQCNSQELLKKQKKMAREIRRDKIIDNQEFLERARSSLDEKNKIRHKMLS